MPRSYRCILVAFVGVALAAAVTPDNRDQGKDPKPSSEIQNSLQTIASAQNKIAAATDTGEYQKPCENGEANDHSDLCAQWYAANAARDAATWTYWGTIVSVVGAVGIVFALLLTVDSNMIARRSARRELRAYMTFAGCHSVVKEGDKTHIRIDWINRGQTPARQANGYACWVALDTTIPDDFDFTVPEAKPEDGPMVAGPQQAMSNWIEDPLPSDVVLLACTGKRHVYVWGAANYRDAFGAERRTEFAAKMIVEHEGMGTFDIKWNAIDRHNDIDEHCERKPGGHLTPPFRKRVAAAWRVLLGAVAT